MFDLTQSLTSHFTKKHSELLLVSISYVFKIALVKVDKFSPTTTTSFILSSENGTASNCRQTYPKIGSKILQQVVEEVGSVRMASYYTKRAEKQKFSRMLITDPKSTLRPRCLLSLGF